MKKGLILLMTIALMTVMVGVGYAAVFSDNETVAGNTFTAGSLDLEVDGANDPITAKFSADNMKPGKNYDGGCVTLTNVGSIPGVLSIKVNNLVSNENGMVEPEVSDGDLAGVEIDPTGYDNNAGDGELWDQIGLGFCIESGAGSHSSNGHCDWDDTRFRAPGSVADDYSSTYSIKTGYDYAASKNIVLQPGESAEFCTEVKFYDDATNYWWGGYFSGGVKVLTNNMAMSDDAQVDFEFGLVQAP